MLLISDADRRVTNNGFRYHDKMNSLLIPVYLFPFILLVPIVCPHGYFGPDCGETCHCLNNTSCDQDTGYCDETDGVCATEYEPNSADDIFCTLCKIIPIYFCTFDNHFCTYLSINLYSNC